MAGRQSKAGRNQGRNRVKCQRYLMRGQRERNKERRIRRHLKRQPSDLAAAAVLADGIRPGRR